MGCNDSGQPPSGWSYYDDEKIREMKARLDLVTSLLCDVCRHMEADGGPLWFGKLHNTPGLHGWWEAHKADDRRRVVAEVAQREQSRREAIAEAEELEARARALRTKVGVL